MPQRREGSAIGDAHRLLAARRETRRFPLPWLEFGSPAEACDACRPFRNQRNQTLPSGAGKARE